MLLELTGSNHGIEYNPGGLTFVKNRIGCPKKARADIGFDAAVELEEGMRRLIDWRQSHKDAVERRRQKARVG